MCNLEGSVLIVDDDKNFIETLMRQLMSKFTNIRIETAGSFDAGVNKIVSSDYDLVLVDYHLDGKHNAYDLIAENTRKSPVVIMTADRSKLANGYDVWYKPLGREELVSNVEQVLRVSHVFEQMQSVNNGLRGFFGE
jgi:DNA-binding response OmpR family regulator